MHTTTNAAEDTITDMKTDLTTDATTNTVTDTTTETITKTLKPQLDNTTTKTRVEDTNGVQIQSKLQLARVSYSSPCPNADKQVPALLFQLSWVHHASPVTSHPTLSTRASTCILHLCTFFVPCIFFAAGQTVITAFRRLTSLPLN